MRTSSSCSDLKSGQRAAKSDSPRSLPGEGKRRIESCSSPSEPRWITLAIPTSGRESSAATRSAKLPFEHLDVGVEQEDVAAPRPGDADVVAGGEAAVGGAQHLDVVELALDRLRGAVAGGAVDDDPLGPQVAERGLGRAQRAQGHLAPVVGHDHDAQVRPQIAHAGTARRITAGTRAVHPAGTSTEAAQVHIAAMKRNR